MSNLYSATSPIIDVLIRLVVSKVAVMYMICVLHFSRFARTHPQEREMDPKWLHDEHARAFGAGYSLPLNSPTTITSTDDIRSMATPIYWTDMATILEAGKIHS